MQRLFAKIARNFTKKTPRRLSTSLSDDQVYPQACLDATNNYGIFANFRRLPDYNAILEHVGEEAGRDYLRLLSRDADVLAAIDEFKRNDDWGNPRTFDYPGVGAMSPTTLRYVKVLADLKSHFGTLDGLDICEIGVGYGGQCRVINAFYKPARYRLVDIGPALGLAQRYLDNYVLPATMSYLTMNELTCQKYDLVISNYAFTELPRAIQDVYLQKIITSSARGYITYNEITPASFESYKCDELMAKLPGSRRLDEEPLSHAGNCIIVWG